MTLGLRQSLAWEVSVGDYQVPAIDRDLRLCRLTCGKACLSGDGPDRPNLIFDQREGSAFALSEGPDMQSLAAKTAERFTGLRGGTKRRSALADTVEGCSYSKVLYLSSQ
jgi:hypothetical protein